MIIIFIEWYSQLTNKRTDKKDATTRTQMHKTNLVCWEPSLATILVHLDKVQGSVESARQLGDVHVKGELPVTPW